MVTIADHARRVVRVAAGLALGAVTAFVELAYLVIAGVALVAPGMRGRVYAGARLLAELERRRLARFQGVAGAADYTPRRALAYLAVRCVVGGLGAGIFLLIGYGVAVGVIAVWQVASGGSIGDSADPTGIDWYDPIAFVLFGILLLFLAVQGLVGVAELDRRLAQQFLAPSRQELLRRRVSQLSTTRAEVLEAVTDERRRIERDLHDGVQQRLVALGMLLGRARRAGEPGQAARLLRQAHDESQQALRELREVTWRVYPIALDEGGLHTALEALAERSSVPVRLRYVLAERVDPATETVAYFVVSEAVTNAIKHAAASRIEVGVERNGSVVVVRVGDDGVGGARSSGGGLSGLARRVAAADGEFTVDSPVGGPTTVTAVLPCG